METEDPLSYQVGSHAPSVECWRRTGKQGRQQCASLLARPRRDFEFAHLCFNWCLNHGSEWNHVWFDSLPNVIYRPMSLARITSLLGGGRRGEGEKGYLNVTGRDIHLHNVIVKCVDLVRGEGESKRETEIETETKTETETETVQYLIPTLSLSETMDSDMGRRSWVEEEQ